MAPWQDDAPSWRDDEFWLDIDDEDMPGELCEIEGILPQPDDVLWFPSE